jgi:hypothetical protein
MKKKEEHPPKSRQRISHRQRLPIKDWRSSALTPTAAPLMSRSETDGARRELFRRLAEQLALEALELEQIVKDQGGR